MTPLGPSKRATPASGVAPLRTPEAGTLRTDVDARSSQGLVRALMLLVDRLDEMARTSASDSAAMDAAQAAARDALRQLAARARDGALLCRIVDGALVLQGVHVAHSGPHAETSLEALQQRMLALGAASITIRDGAAPGELLTLARLITSSRKSVDLAPPQGSETPTTVHAFALNDDPPQELLRSWSVLVTPVVSSRAAAAHTLAPGTALARLASVRSDDTAVSAVATLSELLDDAQRRGDAAAVEAVARGVVSQLQIVGSGGGRVALESALRVLLRPALLSLLAQRLPIGDDRVPLLQVISRAGDAGVDVLLGQLLVSDDPLARRAYFDGIVAMDVGSPVLFDLLRDARWFVVRNAAALLGEMHVNETDTALLPLLRHADARIRMAAARALIRVRTPKALQGLHAAIDDRNAEVRRLAAAAFGLAGGAVGGIRPPAARLAVALTREADEDVALEMLAALGRLGSADAVQRLLRIAIPGSQDFTSGERAAVARDPWQRIGAMEALARARGHAVLPAIESLLNDADRAVAAAAARLLADITSGVSDP